MSTATETAEPALRTAAPDQLVFNAAQTAVLLGGLISAYTLERQAAAGEIRCTYIAGHLGFTKEHMRELIERGERDPENYGRKSKP